MAKGKKRDNVALLGKVGIVMFVAGFLFPGVGTLVQGIGAGAWGVSAAIKGYNHFMKK